MAKVNCPVPGHSHHMEGSARHQQCQNDNPHHWSGQVELDEAKVEHTRARAEELRGQAEGRRQRGAAAATAGRAAADAANINARGTVAAAHHNAAATAANAHAAQLEAARKVAEARRKGEDTAAAGQRAVIVRQTKQAAAERGALDEARRTSKSHRLAEAEAHEVAKLPYVRREREKELKNLKAKGGFSYKAHAFLGSVFKSVKGPGENKGKQLGNPYLRGR